MPEAKKTTVKKETTTLASSESKVKAAPKTIKVEAAAEVKPIKASVKKTGGLAVTTYSLLGKESGSFDLPKEIFGVEVNKKLLSQALRVYQNNQKGHYANTKTRGQVEGSTRKIYAQKGTGRARHGGVRAPIFVGGGIALGPKTRNTIMDLPQKMKRAALVSALSQKTSESAISALTGVDKATGKTKEFVLFLKNFTESKVANVLVVADKNLDTVSRAIKNMEKVNFVTAENLNVFEVIRHQSIVLTKEAVEALQQRLSGKELPEKKEAAK